jgi:hypothetical protein
MTGMTDKTFSSETLELFGRLLAMARFEVTADSIEEEARIITTAHRELAAALAAPPTGD